MANEDQTHQDQVEESQVDETAEENLVEPEVVETKELTVESLQEELAAANATIAELQKQLAELEPRAQAEIANQRRRAEVEVDKARKFAVEKFAEELLPVIDSLERAIEASQVEDEVVKPLREGVEMTHKMFIDGVAKFNLEVINPEGEAFNPEHHQAMSMVEAEGAAPNSVIAVMQKGYLLNGRLVRPAMVMVAKG
ncbi:MULTISPECIES: nucleotide exchange factor GrpE [unclassified Marinobacterium]|jgi:molecular chaperone GrpE|uniref:nucleotide exchange factor GrpE n=1 Tax=unclassified Marinobacterium TaxID=2644139 RepID=UPI00156A254A|nr:heat shock protein GrpE [Marinobacterium sp. xm-d-543]NRQ23881.1 heat shock protein GrpE [Marinobacterium sp. xm-m-312]